MQRHWGLNMVWDGESGQQKVDLGSSDFNPVKLNLQVIYFSKKKKKRSF